ncbi:Zinc finger UBP-type profile [Nakaseomyces glabratus]
MSDQILQGLEVPAIIAKEECIYCFETPYNPEKPGSKEQQLTDSTKAAHTLNICLVCFQAVCPRHTPFHIEVGKHNDAQHFDYLNVAKVRKYEDMLDGEEDEDTNSSKKIKLQVIEKSRDEDYNDVWSLLHFESSQSSPHIVLKSNEANAAQTEKVDHVLNAKSQDLADQANVWELDIKPCKHVDSFSFANVQEKPLETHCSSCELTQNLWICLYCGNLGCGREQVGIEGHSHALEHFKSKNDHCLAIKLGSLSSSSFDLYCYACDDEVKFNDLQVLKTTLAKYGIDMDKKSADEKTLVELQVEQNMNWDFKMVDEKGQQLKQLNASQELGCGLINLGNSCYLNSTLQCLFNGGVKGWDTDMLGNSPSLNVVYPANNLKSQLTKLRTVLKEEPTIYKQGIRPKSFKKCIGGSHEEFSSGRQQDALEFFTYFVDELDKKLFKNSDYNPNDLMKFMMEDRLQCQECHGVKYSTETSNVIQLPLQESNDAQDLEERINAYFSGEVIEFKCPNCKKMVNAVKKPAMRTFPDTLVINPIRIKIENWTPVKTSNLLTIPGLETPTEVLELTQYKGNGLQKDTETQLNDDNDEIQFEVNETFVNQLMEMGFTENACVRALYHTGNKDPELAMNWLFGHIEDADVNAEFIPPKKAKNDVNPEHISMMVGMGLDPKLCRKALILNNHDVTRSVDWVFNNMDDDGEIEELKEQSDTSKTYGHHDAKPYELSAIICHKGNSVHSGHYVAFIRKMVDGKPTWVLYNDEKIVVSNNFEEMMKNSYMLFYSRT